MASLAAVVLCAMAARAAPSPAAARVNWLSHPVRANETVLVSGAFGADASFVLRPGRGPSVTISAGQTDAHTASFVLPASTLASAAGGEEEEVYAAWQVDGGRWLNTPDIWWFQGDLGKAASSGGELRVFGRSLCANGALASPTLRLRSKGTAAAHFVKNISAEPASCDAFHAKFRLDGVPAGTYEGDMLGGGSAAAAGWAPLRMFSSAADPRDGTITVQTAGGLARALFGERVFNVAAYCTVGTDCGVVGTNSSFAVLAALRAARAAGGGTVLIPRGQWFLNHTAGALAVPPNTLLRGEAASLTAVFFPEQMMGEAPTPAYLYGDFSAAASWGVEDLTVYISRYYSGVVNCGASTDGFSMRRVRVRANAFAMLGAPVGSPSRGRSANYTQPDVGAAVRLEGCTNFVIADNDIYATWAVFQTGGKTSSGADAPNSDGGLILRNTIWNGGGVLNFDSVRGIVFEGNTATGISLAAFGSNIADYNYYEGFAHHVYMHANRQQHVWGADREVVTLDPCSGSFTANVAAADGTALAFNMSSAHGGPAGVVPGGLVSILDGAGAGQYRRLTSNAGNGSVTIDAPFDTPLDATSLAQLSDMRGQMIFDANEFTDTGAFQLYGNAYDVVVANTVFTRATGLFSWALAESDHNYCPNLRVQFLGNRVVEGAHMFNYVSDRLGNEGKVMMEPYTFNVVTDGVQFGGGGGDQPPLPYAGPLARLVVLRRNTVDSNGGIFLGGASAGIVMEHNVVANSTCLPRHGVSQSLGACIGVDRAHLSGVIVTRGNIAAPPPATATDRNY